MHHSDKTWPEDTWLPKASLLRVVGAIIAQEVAANRRQDVHQLRPDLWDEETPFLEEGLALDSLERMNCAAALNRFFHLSDYGAEDYLLGARTLGDWAYVVAISIANGSENITFETSGTTGAPKPCPHQVADLLEETKAWAAHFCGIEAVIAMASPQHIYGFIWTVFLPQYLEAQVIDARFANIKALNAALSAPGALLVAAPPHWHYVSRSGLVFPSSLRGVTSTAPMSAQLAQQLKAQGLGDLMHIYGSSETGGVGWRNSPEGAYQPLPYLTLSQQDEETRMHRSDGRTTSLMDRTALKPDGHFDVLGRRDGAVQVGGINVYPSRVEEVLKASDAVAECCVRLCSKTGRLMADIVSIADMEETGLEDALRALCVDALTPAERPAAYRIICAAKRVKNAAL